ncbi:MAG TPA: hypothetical protein PKE65_00380 [Rhizobiaceae bacterium]|nr:hypothetical protein [Rhizobiaceae bacterium]
MKRNVRPANQLALLALGGLLLAVATGVAFAGWLDKGAAMFLALAEAGLSWCL